MALADARQAGSDRLQNCSRIGDRVASVERDGIEQTGEAMVRRRGFSVHDARKPEAIASCSTSGRPLPVLGKTNTSLAR